MLRNGNTRYNKACSRDLWSRNSADMISKITDKIIPLVEEWKSRPLEEVYYFTFLDAVPFSVKEV